VLGRLGTQDDPHLAEGSYDSLRAATPLFTRPYVLLLTQFSHVDVKNSLGTIPSRARYDRRNRPKQYLFSPLYLVRQVLSSPTYLASGAYAHVVVRSEIYAASIEFSEQHRSRLAKADALTSVKSFIEFDQIAASVQKAESYRRNGDTFYPASPTDFILGHLLASRGLALLTFAPGHSSYTPERRNEMPLIGRDTALYGGTLVPDTGIYEFRFLDEIDGIPSAAEIINELDGFPVPIPGAETVFARGLRATASNGVVGRVSGTSGAGKTTLALAIGTALAPLGVTTFYVSCEEEGVDLERRIFTLTPPFIARMSSQPRHIRDWFYSVHLSADTAEENRDTAFAFVDEIAHLYERAGITPAADSPPGIIPLFVVFDGVHELLSNNTHDDQVAIFRNAVSHVRQLGAFVLILTAEIDEPALRELDYAVDFVIKLEHAPQRDSAEEPIRRFILNKTRLQYSRPGAHILHISKHDGVKIYPQLTAQFDEFTGYKWKPIRKDRWYDFLQTGLNAGVCLRPLVRIFERSQVLITGRGSSGKAGFGLKLLMKPTGERDVSLPALFAEETLPDRQPFRMPRRILVISFLYDESYYITLQEAIAKNLNVDSASRHPAPVIELDVLSLYPGFLSPEVLMRKIIEKNASRKLSGSGYHGILIDGLHNVFLQFPRLQGSPMLWPTLFEIFRILGATVVTTHTLFTIKGMESIPQVLVDVDAAMHRVGPVLQALVNGADYYLDLSASDRNERGKFFAIEVIAALGQGIRTAPYFWDRENSSVVIRLPDERRRAEDEGR
jgi:KaiC/GvpD/RAD55 family RecA-like ATPase